MPRTAEPYDPKTYWTRLHETPDLRAVGQSGVPVELNQWLYRILEHNLRSFLRRQGLVAHPPARVYEVGIGTGFWTPFWYDLGAREVDGCDLVEVAVERLRQRYPKATFTAGDIADPSVVPDDASYDLVTVMNVLLHVMDEERFGAACAHIAAAVKPGGHLLLVEPALLGDSTVREVRPGASSRARTLSVYRAPFEAAGLEFVTAEACTVVGNNPNDPGQRGFHGFERAWRTAARHAKKGPRRADLVGRILFVADRPLMRTGAAPSGKIILFRRPAQTRGEAG